MRIPDLPSFIIILFYIGSVGYSIVRIARTAFSRRAK